MVNKTIGIAGDYTDIGLAWAYLISLTPLADDYTFTVISDVTEATGASGAGPVFNGHTVSFVNPNNYNIDTAAFSYSFKPDTTATLADVLTLDGLVINYSGTLADTTTPLLECKPNVDGDVATFNIKNCYLTGYRYERRGIGIKMFSFGSTYHVWNNKIVAFATGIYCDNTDGTSAGTDHIIENNSVYGCDYGVTLCPGASGKTWTVRNTVSVNSDTLDFTSGSNAFNLIKNCADGDNSISLCGATATGCITGIASLDFISAAIFPATADFMLITVTSRLWAKGLIPSAWNTLDVSGNARPDWLTMTSIGVCEPKIKEQYMSTNALNQVYKTAIVAVEECPLAADVIPTATTLIIAGNYMTATPFVVGREYILRDNGFTAGADGVPNAERIQVTSVAAMVATPNSDGLGYVITGAIGVIGYTANGFSGGVIGTYTMAKGVSVLTPGVEIAIQSADFNCRFKTLTDAPKIDFDDESSRFATGDEGRDISIAGARSAEINLTEKLSWAGDVKTVPTWAKIMRTMGHAVKTYTTTGIGFLPHTWANETTATIWIIAPENGMNPTSTVYRYCGAHGGNGSSISVGKIGDVWMLTGKYSAAYVGTKEIPFSAARVLTSPDSKVPEVMLSNQITVPAVFGHTCTPYLYADVAALVTAEVLVVGSVFNSTDATDTTDAALLAAKTAVLGGSPVLMPGDTFRVLTASTCAYIAPEKTVEISQFSLDFGGVVNPFIDQSTPTGNAYYATQDRDPKFTCNPYHIRKTADDIDFVASQMLTGPVTVASALVNPHLTLEIPNGQLLSPALASREGYVNTNRTYRCLRNDTGAGVKEAALAKGIMYEILIGQRS